MVLSIYIRIHLYTYSNVTTKSCRGPKGSNGNVIPFYGHGMMDEHGWYFIKNNMKVYCDMITRNWAIWGFDIFIVCSMHNTSGKGCNYRFNQQIS
jgi:hypothetical protein